MSDTRTSPKPLPVPSGRLNRFTRLSATTMGIAGNMAVNALGEVGRGTRPNLRSLLMTPDNIQRLADQLARMRGAAMKVGQLISMDAGDVLPPELADIMGRLRDQAHFMPPKQLRQVLNRNWGADWLSSFQRFDPHPIAAASIGQVHRALLKDGRDVAIKVQYPGIARSIDSDVANVGVLVKMSGLVPKGFDLDPYLVEARKQLHDETDYALEGQHLVHFAGLLADSSEFSIPEFHGDWSTGEVLTMSYIAGRPIESLESAPLDERNRVTAALIDLTLRELFEFGVTQSDPNFANYRYDPKTGQIVLLDFGATRFFEQNVAAGYRAILRAGLAGDEAALRKAAISMQFIDGAGAFDHKILGLMQIVFDAVTAGETFDFGDRTLSQRMNAEGQALAEAGYVPPHLPMDALYLQRKFGGMFLLASKLRAILPIQAQIDTVLRSTEGAAES